MTAFMFRPPKPGLRNTAEQDIRPNPPCAPRGCSERLSFLDDLADEEVLRHNEEIDDGERFEVVIHQEQVWIVARRQPLAFGLECAIDYPRAEFAFLALEFELLFAGDAEEIGERAVVGEWRNLCIAAVWAISPGSYPRFRPCASTLRAARISGLGFFEAEFHRASVARLARNASASCYRLTSSFFGPPAPSESRYKTTETSSKT
jgi:hypothetical protein